MESEDILLDALRRREPEAFERLIAAYADRIYRLAVSLLENEDEADGIVQDTFLRLFEKFGGFERRSSLGTPIYLVFKMSTSRKAA